MSCTPEAAAHLQQVAADLVRTAESDLPPLEKLELLCLQIGTAQYCSISKSDKRTPDTNWPDRTSPRSRSCHGSRDADPRNSTSDAGYLGGWLPSK